MHATPAQAAVMKLGLPLTSEPTRTAGIAAMYGLGPIEILLMPFDIESVDMNLSQAVGPLIKECLPVRSEHDPHRMPSERYFSRSPISERLGFNLLLRVEMNMTSDWITLEKYSP